MSKYSLGLLAAAAALLCTVTVTPVSGQRNGGVVDLPEGAGRDVAARTCTQCHGTNMITGSWGYTQQGWKDLFGSMVLLPNDQVTVISSYLAAHFPEKPRPK